MRLGFLMALLLVLPLAGLGQDKQTKEKADKPEVKKLTQQEMASITEANTALTGYLNGLQKALEATLTVSDEKGAEAVGWKIAVVFRNVREGQDKLNKLVQDMLKKYDCLGCQIGQDGTLIPSSSPK